MNLFHHTHAACQRHECATLNVDVAGGGPVGLMLAILLRAFLGDAVRIRIFDRRWRDDADRVVWQNYNNGNNRRRQVVTLQSNVWGTLPRELQEAIFVTGQFSEVWPFGPDSPANKGRPRNIRIRSIEDCLLELAQNRFGIELVPTAYMPPETWKGLHVLAICDGPRSETRRLLAHHFGTPSRELYSINGVPFDEVVLGLEVRSDLPDEHTVPLTVCQNRFLYNPLFNGGFINMRLTSQEAAEVVGITEAGPTECVQRHPCFMRPMVGGFTCETHGALFKPSVDPFSFLWPRIQDGLRFFGVPRQNLLGVTAFRLGMENHSCFTAQMGPGTFACLLGDAACAIHFWPGRGLNTGFKSALSLARCLKTRWHGRPLRAADFTVHEGLMHQLQYREKSRAWTIMRMPDEYGTPRSIHDRISAGLTPPFDRESLKRQLWERMCAIKSRIANRMGPLPEDDHWYMQRLDGLDDATLKILVETGPWITTEVGGEEVSVDAAFPP